MLSCIEFKCVYCNKNFINNRSVSQHQWRCKLNPEHKDNWNVGKNKTNSESIYNQSIKVSKFLKNKPEIIYTHKEHNDAEIAKWRRYISQLELVIPEYKTRENQGYNIVVGNSHEHTSGTHYTSEQKYLIELVFNHKLPEGTVIHHIDENKLNNSLDNLLVFASMSDHSRFHANKLSYLIYDELSHLFTCVVSHQHTSMM